MKLNISCEFEITFQQFITTISRRYLENLLQKTTITKNLFETYRIKQRMYRIVHHTCLQSGHSWWVCTQFFRQFL